MTTQLEARAFAIWRYANPRQWDVSYEEIADATGLTYSQVLNTIQFKGWGGRIGTGRKMTEAKDAGHWKRTALSSKARGVRFDENALDVVQLMGVTA